MYVVACVEPYYSVWTEFSTINAVAFKNVEIVVILLRLRIFYGIKYVYANFERFLLNFMFLNISGLPSYENNFQLLEIYKKNIFLSLVSL